MFCTDGFVSFRRRGKRDGQKYHAWTDTQMAMVLEMHQAALQRPGKFVQKEFHRQVTEIAQFKALSITTMQTWIKNGMPKKLVRKGIGAFVDHPEILDKIKAHILQLEAAGSQVKHRTVLYCTVLCSANCNIMHCLVIMCHVLYCTVM